MVDLMERGFVSGILMNGAGCVHDLELAMMGRTSEDVAPGPRRRQLRHGPRDDASA